MKIAMWALSDKAIKTAAKLSNILKCHLYISKYDLPGIDFIHYSKSIEIMIKEKWLEYDAFIFVMTAEEALKLITPLVNNGLREPAVVVIDERGKFVIKLLTGSLGIADELSFQISAITAGQAVAAESKGMTKFHLRRFINSNNLIIENIDNFKYIQSALQSGSMIYLCSQIKIEGEAPANVSILSYSEALTRPYRSPLIIITCYDELTNSDSVYYKLLLKHRALILRPRNIVLGAGCKSEADVKAFESAALSLLKDNQISPLSLKSLVSADVKANEECMVKFCKKYNISFKTYSLDMITAAEREFAESDFVREIVGAGNLAECCAYLETGGIPILSKSSIEGITLALSISEETIKIF